MEQVEIYSLPGQFVSVDWFGNTFCDMKLNFAWEIVQFFYSICYPNVICYCLNMSI
jgi:hypothetical protein